MRPLDITGERYGHLTAVEFTGRRQGKSRLWLCRCDCGNECEVMIGNLRHGHTVSCGCLRKPYKLDLLGRRCGRLTVLAPTPRRAQREGTGAYLWRCQCDCGNLIEVSGTKLRSGHTQSCGCLWKDSVATQGGITTDPITRPIWHLWHGIRYRCHNPNDTNFPAYGGRGITLHESWRDDPWAFVEWVLANLGPRPEGASLDRIDNDGGYEPGNLRWASRSTQQRNRRPHIYVRGAEAEKLRAYAAAAGITPAEALTLAIEHLS